MSKINTILSDIASKKSTAVAITQGYLDRIAKLNPELNAYAEIYTERALEQTPLRIVRDQLIFPQPRCRNTPPVNGVFAKLFLTQIAKPVLV